MEQQKNSGKKTIFPQAKITVTTLAEEMDIQIKFKFDTESEKKLFQEILFLLTNISDNIICEKRAAVPVSLSPNRLQEIITRWYPSKHDMRKTEVIEDIISKVQKSVVGKYYYECRHSKYKLDISESGCYLHDLLRDRVYCFVK